VLERERRNGPAGGGIPLEAAVIIEEEATAAKEARPDRPGLTIFTDGSRLENGATGYAAVWKKGNDWEGLKSHMSWGQEAYDAECAALARAFQTAASQDDASGRSPSFRTRKRPSQG